MKRILFASVLCLALCLTGCSAGRDSVNGTSSPRPDTSAFDTSASTSSAGTDDSAGTSAGGGAAGGAGTVPGGTSSAGTDDSAGEIFLPAGAENDREAVLDGVGRVIAAKASGEGVAELGYSDFAVVAAGGVNLLSGGEAVGIRVCYRVKLLNPSVRNGMKAVPLARAQVVGGELDGWMLCRTIFVFDRADGGWRFGGFSTDSAFAPDDERMVFTPGDPAGVFFGEGLTDGFEKARLSDREAMAAFALAFFESQRGLMFVSGTECCYTDVRLLEVASSAGAAGVRVKYALKPLLGAAASALGWGGRFEPGFGELEGWLVSERELEFREDGSGLWRPSGCELGNELP